MALGADRHGDIVTQHNPTTGDRTTSRAYDPFGTPTATLNATGGNETSSWAGNLGFQADWTDPATNRVNMGARWYTPTAATFTTRDTYNIPLQTHINPNRYTYANANPINYNDPDGHCAVSLDFEPCAFPAGEQIFCLQREFCYPPMPWPPLPPDPCGGPWVRCGITPIIPVCTESWQIPFLDGCNHPPAAEPPPPVVAPADQTPPVADLPPVADRPPTDPGNDINSPTTAPPP